MMPLWQRPASLQGRANSHAVAILAARGHE